MRLIDADKLEYRKCSFKGGVIEDILYKKDIKRAAIVDAQPVIHARWIEHDVSNEIEEDETMRNFFPEGKSYECSKCHICIAYEFFYCHHCGAKMDGEKE